MQCSANVGEKSFACGRAFQAFSAFHLLGRKADRYAVCVQPERDLLQDEFIRYRFGLTGRSTVCLHPRHPQRFSPQALPSLPVPLHLFSDTRDSRLSHACGRSRKYSHSADPPAEFPTSPSGLRFTCALRPMLPPCSEAPILHLVGVQFLKGAVHSSAQCLAADFC